MHTSLAGVLLLVYYALPVEVPGGPVVLSAEGGGGPEWEADLRRYERTARIGLALVIAGTLMEAVPPFCTAIGSWRRRPIAPQVPRQEDTDPRPRRPPVVNSKPVQDGPSMEALPLTRLLHDNMAIVVTFVFSQAPIK